MLRPGGKAAILAHIRAYENANNPDGTITYGVRGISDECAADWPTDQFGPPVYPGQLDSHPYATLQTRKTIYVADAGMNAVLAVSRSGKIRTVAVTPAVPVEITADLAKRSAPPTARRAHLLRRVGADRRGDGARRQAARDHARRRPR